MLMKNKMPEVMFECEIVVDLTEIQRANASNVKIFSIDWKMRTNIWIYTR